MSLGLPVLARTMEPQLLENISKTHRGPLGKYVCSLCRAEVGFL